MSDHLGELILVMIVVRVDHARVRGAPVGLAVVALALMSLWEQKSMLALSLLMQTIRNRNALAQRKSVRRDRGACSN